MKAMIFAAGLGTRLRPITNDIPKAMVPINGVPLLEINLNKLIKAGFDQIIVNVHHFPDKITQFIKQKKWNAEIVISDETDQLLDTGGGLLKASWFLRGDGPFLLLNADIITDLDLSSIYREHDPEKEIATLWVRERKGGRFFLFDNNMRLCGWENQKTGEIKISYSTYNILRPLAFSAVHVVSPVMLDMIEETGVFSIVDLYLRLAQKHVVKGWLNNRPVWFDIGTTERLYEAEQFVKSNLGQFF